MTCVDTNVSMELFEKEAMAWDIPQMRCKAPVGAQKGEGSGRPKRKSDRKTKRSQGEKKASGRALKAAKLTHSQAGPSLAVNKIKEKEERVMGTEDKENAGTNHAPKPVAVLTTNRLTQKLHTGIYGQGKASGRILRRKALGDLKAPNIESELQRILGMTSIEESSTPEQKGTAVGKGCSHVGAQNAKCSSNDAACHQEGPASPSAVTAPATDSSDAMDDTPRRESIDEEATMKGTANAIIASLEPEKMFKCAGYVDSLKNDLRKMLRNNNPQLYCELMAKFQQKRAKSLDVHSHSLSEVPLLENDPEALTHDPTFPTAAANASPSSSSPLACGITNTPGVLMDTSNDVRVGLAQGLLQPKTVCMPGHTQGAENEGYTCSSAPQKDCVKFSAFSLNCDRGGGIAERHHLGGVGPSQHLQFTRDLSHVMLNSQSDPNLFRTNTVLQKFSAQEYGLMVSTSPEPQSMLTTAGQLSPCQHGNTHRNLTTLDNDQPGFDFLEIVDNQHVYNLPSRPHPVIVSRLSPPKMYPQKMF